MKITPYILAARPKTLPAAIVPVWIGCVLAFYLEKSFSLPLALYTLFGAVFIQIGTNFFNDAIDSDKGADTENRLGPVRATASGLLSRQAVYLTATVCLLIAAVFGFLLYQAVGWQIIAIGIPSLYLCFGYTGGPYPLAYKGLGEVFVVLFFGIIAVMGTVFVQLQEWRIEAALLGLQTGLLSAVLISINNLRDRVEDASNNKRTLAVLLGEKKAKQIINAELFLPAALGIVWTLIDPSHLKLASYTSCYVLIAIYLKIQIQATPVGKIYNKYLALGGIQLILFGILVHLVIS